MNGHGWIRSESPPFRVRKGRVSQGPHGTIWCRWTGFRIMRGESDKLEEYGDNSDVVDIQGWVTLAEELLLDSILRSYRQIMSDVIRNRRRYTSSLWLHSAQLGAQTTEMDVVLHRQSFSLERAARGKMICLEERVYVHTSPIHLTKWNIVRAVLMTWMW